MEKKYIALIIIAIIAIIGVAVAATTQTPVQHTQIDITQNSTPEGENIEVKLVENDTPVVNETVNLTLVSVNGSRNTVNVTTNDEGIANYTFENVSNETFLIECSYGSSEKVNMTVPFGIAQDNLTFNETDPGAFYAEQDGRWHYTGDVELGADENYWIHMGMNEWEILG